MNKLLQVSVTESLEQSYYSNKAGLCLQSIC